MTDELDDLKAAMQAATPAPDAQKKRDNIALAEKNFADLQGSRNAARPTHQTGPRKSLAGRILNGVGTMLNVFTTRAGLTATTALVAVGLLVVMPGQQDFTEGFAPTTSLKRNAEATPEARRDAATETVLADDPDTSAPAETVLREEADLVEAEPVVDAPAPQMEDSAIAGIVSAPTDAVQDTRTRKALESLAQGALLGQTAKKESSTQSRRLQAPTADNEFAVIIEPPVITPETDTEDFANAPENTLKVTTEEPVSTFSIDVDTASYGVVRQSLMSGHLPPSEAVRVEEMINYFPYAYPAPEGSDPFQPTITVAPTPWNPGTNLVHIGIQGTLPAIEDRPPLNLVFLIDTSGSMQDTNKLPLLKQSFRLMLSELRPEDEVSIVTYAGSAGQVLEPTRAGERQTILAALDRLAAGGSTAGQAGLQQAYQVAEAMSAEGEVTRVLLATDGDFNVGLSDPEALKDFIAKKRDTGTYLSVLGFGRGNLDDATMQSLAQNGNGQAAYIDTLSEARKVLVDQLTGALFPIANDVKIQVEFNPAQVAEYRLIGYETRALNREDFNNDRVDAGDIGAGHRVTAIYEVTPVGSDAIRNGPLRYAEAEKASTKSDELGFFKLRYKRPGENSSTLIESPIRADQGTATSEVRFSIAMAGFGDLLRGGTYLGNWGWQDAIDLANGAKGDDAFGYRAEAVTLMRLAESLSR